MITTWRILPIAALVFCLLTACSAPAETQTVPAVNGSDPSSGSSAVSLAPLKILVSERGMVQVTAQDLSRQKVDLKTLDPARLSLTLRGEPQPLEVRGSGSSLSLVFFGTPSDSPYTVQNVYLLQTVPAGQALPMPERDGTAAGAPSAYFTQTVRLEENLVYSPLVEDGEHWFIASLPAGQSKTFSLEIDNPAPVGANLRLFVWSSTTSSVSPNHHLRVSVNDQVTADDHWDGIGAHLLTGSIPPGVLKPGANTILVEAPGDTGAVVDTNFINWLEIDYGHTPAAPGGGGFEAAAPGSALAFDNAAGRYAVYEISDPQRPSRVVPGAADQKLVFATTPGGRYWLAPEDGYLKPAAIAPARLSPDLKTLTDHPLGADYLAVGPENLLAELKPLLELRQSQGLTPAAIPLQAVFDQFGAGFPEPQAVQRFLTYASQNWQIKPRFVLLVGDATYDPRGYLAPAEANQLPTFFVPSFFGGQTGSDVLMTVPDGAVMPALAIGRIPAQQPRQVSLYVQKVLQSEREAAQGGTVLAVADGQEAGFKEDARLFLEQVPAGYTQESYNPPNGETGAAKIIQGYVEKGAALIAYFGHGSVNMWGKDRLFTAEEARGLRNTHLPVFVTMTCLNGYFIHPKVESLAEALLWSENGGAVAVLAPTSLTTASDQARLREPFIQALLVDKKTLGEALLFAQQQSYPGAQVLSDVQRTFMLFGDPALTLK